jgi:hypothetical protein
MDRAQIVKREEGMRRALDSYRAAQARGFDSLIAKSVADLRHFDVPGMDDIVSVCYWGRSGSVLLASFLDKHPNVVLLPGLRGQRIYRFIEKYQLLSLREKLITYPVMAEEYGDPFFYGNFSISETDYYAAVDALLQVYGHLPAEYLASRRAFVQFIHAAYSLALGRHPATPRPLMVYAQHNFDGAVAQQIVEDFPKARFLHTVRNPVATFDSGFDWIAYLILGDGQLPPPDYLTPVLDVLDGLVPPWRFPELRRDRPHPGMAERTRAVRFEDMHVSNAGTLRAVTQWLGISEVPSPGDSSFNGIPFTAESRGTDWTGPRPEQVGRPLRYTSSVDQALLSALFYENFIAWGYPCRDIFGRVWFRRLSTTLCLLLPMRMEIAAARRIMRLQVLPALRQGRYAFAFRAFALLFTSHWHLSKMVSAEVRRRVNGKVGQATSGHFEILRPIEAVRTDPASTAAVREDPDALAQLLITEYGDVHAASEPIDNAAAAIARAATLLAPVVQGIRDHVFAAGQIHAVDKPVTILSRTTRQRIAGRVWIYLRDDRPSDPAAHPAVAVYYSEGRGPEHRREHLRSFQGFLQADLRAGDEACLPGSIIEVACWAHWRFRFSDIWSATGTVVAWQALERIAAIYAVESEARYQPFEQRLQIRAAARPLLESFFAWAEAELRKRDAESALAQAFCDILPRRAALTRFLDHDGLEIDNQCLDPLLRGIRFSERSWMLSANDAPGNDAAAIYSLIETTSLNGVDLRVYLKDVLQRLMENPTQPAGSLLPWNWTGA